MVEQYPNSIVERYIIDPLDRRRVQVHLAVDARIVICKSSDMRKKYVGNEARTEVEVGVLDRVALGIAIVVLDLCISRGMR